MFLKASIYKNVRENIVGHNPQDIEHTPCPPISSNIFAITALGEPPPFSPRQPPLPIHCEHPHPPVLASAISNGDFFHRKDFQLLDSSINIQVTQVTNLKSGVLLFSVQTNYNSIYKTSKIRKSLSSVFLSFQKRQLTDEMAQIISFIYTFNKIVLILNCIYKSNILKFIFTCFQCLTGPTDNHNKQKLP